MFGEIAVRRRLHVGSSPVAVVVDANPSAIMSIDNSMVRGVTTLDLVGTHEIAQLLGVTRQRVDALARSSASFPAPVATVAAGRIWLREEVETWAAATGRLPRHGVARSGRRLRSGSPRVG